MALKRTVINVPDDDERPDEPENSTPGQELEPVKKKQLTGGQLRARDAQIIELDARGWSDRAIAAKFGLSVNAVWKAIHRGWAMAMDTDITTSRRKADFRIRQGLDEAWQLFGQEAWKTTPTGKQIYSPVTGKPLVDVVAKATVLREIREFIIEYRKLHGTDAAKKKITANVTIDDPELVAELAELRKKNGVADTRTDPRVLRLVDGGYLVDDDEDDGDDGDTASG